MPLISSTSALGDKPRVILGLMTFGPPGTEAKGARIATLDDFNQNLDYLQKSGYNEVDTARMYIQGDQEAFTREAKWQERGLSLATKCYPVASGDSSRKVIVGGHRDDLLLRTCNLWKRVVRAQQEEGAADDDEHEERIARMALPDTGHCRSG